MEAKTWTVPAERMKMKREHVVPLTDAALVVLRSMAIAGTKPDAYVFPGRGDNPLSNMSMSMAMRRWEVSEYTVHGFRSAFRDWVGEKTAFPSELAEMALAHLVGSAVERAYRRGSALEKRREMMEAWSRFLQTGGTKVAIAPVKPDALATPKKSRTHPGQVALFDPA
jgi:integrase